MTTKMSAHATFCGYKSIITVTKDGKTIKVHMASPCQQIQKYAENLEEVEMKDLYQMEGSRIMKAATMSRVSPSCIVPVAIMNACWIECGMNSKNLALQKKELKITFEE